MHLVVRADADTRQGTGHLMRCLALTQAWRDAGGAATLVTARSDIDLSQRFLDEGVQVVTIEAAYPDPCDVSEVLAIAKATAPCWVVVDGYHFDVAYSRALRASGARLLRIDDHGTAAPYAADVLLDPNVGARVAAEGPTRALAGPGYALLRRDFAARPSGRRSFALGAGRVLVTLGGAPDPHVLASVVDALGRLPRVKAQVVAGPTRVARVPANVRIHDRVDDMRALMDWADVAVSAAGSTAYELAALGVPALLVATVENQMPVALALAHAGAAVAIPRTVALDPSALSKSIEAFLSDVALLERIGRAGPQIVDRRGAANVVAELLSDLIELRAATVADARILWELANEPTVRAASFSTAPIDWETHVSWFERRLADPASPLFLARNASGELIGQVRFDATDGGPEIGVAVVPGARGRGLGSALIRAGVRRWVGAGGHGPVKAWIRPENVASIRAFERAGFQSRSRGHRGEVEAILFTFEVEESGA